MPARRPRSRTPRSTRRRAGAAHVDGADRGRPTARAIARGQRRRVVGRGEPAVRRRRRSAGGCPGSPRRPAGCPAPSLRAGRCSSPPRARGGRTGRRRGATRRVGRRAPAARRRRPGPRPRDPRLQRGPLGPFADQGQPRARGAAARTAGQASISVSSPFSGASRPTNDRAGRRRQSGRRCQGSLGHRDAVGQRRGSSPGRSRRASSSSRDRRRRSRRRRRPAGSAGRSSGRTGPSDCQARSPVAPAPSGRSTTGNPAARPTPTAT